MIEPGEFISHIRSLKRIKDIEAGILSLFFNDRLSEEYFREISGAREGEWIFKGEDSRRLYIFEIEGRIFSFIRLELGAPLSAFMMELLIACGTRFFIHFGSAGSIHPSCGIGDFVIPSSALIGEGVSKYYVEGEEVPSSSKISSFLGRALCDEGIKYHRGKVWTMDAIFRETRDEIKEARERGAICVDMETSALYSVARFRGVEASSLLFIGDSLSGDRWEPCFKGRGKFIRKGCDVLLSALKLMSRGASF